VRTGPERRVQELLVCVLVPLAIVARAAPHRFNYPGPEQHPGIYGDRTVKITVYNGPPDGGTSNSVSLRVFAKWLAEEKKLGK